MKRTEPDYMESSNLVNHFPIQRRDFLKILGGGILILINPLDSCGLSSPSGQAQRSLPKDFNAFLHIAENGEVTCFTGKIEMGQGPITALVQMMADELDVPFERVKIIMGDTDLCPWDEGTWGSTSIRAFGPKMRAAAAEAKAVLMQLAAEQLGVPVTQLEAADGVISDKQDRNKKITYAQLTKGKKIEKHISDKIALKDPAGFKVIGKPFLRQDAKAKVTGEAKYSGDMLLPGMLHARIVRPPSHGAKLLSADTSEAEKIKGIKVVRDGDMVALLHENRDILDKAIVKVKAEYSFDEMKVNDKSIYEHYLKTPSTARVFTKKGDIDSGKQISDTVLESEFHHAYVAHSPIEPHAAAATMEGDRIIVWATTQRPFGTQEEIAAKLNLPLDKIRVITPFVGGGFGGKADNPQAIEAAVLTKKTGKPVMVAFTREEEFFYDTTRPAAVVKLASGMDKSGKLTFWDYNVYYCGSRGAETIYDIPNQKSTSYDQGKNDPKVHPFATGPWRGPGNSNNTFAREMQICLMASKAGMDQLDFRLKNLKDEKMIAVLRAAADKFGYTPGKSPGGRGIGIACGTDVGTWVALIAEVKVNNETGHVQVIRVVCAQDMGLCVNPQGTILQIEGCITMGLGYTFTEELKFEGGKMFNKNFDTYEIPHFSWVPKIDSVILQKLDQPPRGGGEPAITAVGGVVGSAIFDATGAVLYQMPMTPERVLEALKKV